MGRPAEHDRAIYQSLRYVLQSDALLGEFDSRMGVTEEEVQELLNNWPLRDERLHDRIAIHNALNEVCHGVAISDYGWSQWFTVSRATVAEALRHSQTE